MRSYLLAAGLALAELCSATPGTVSMKMHKNTKKHAAALRRRDLSKRDNTVSATLSGIPYFGGGFYYANVTVGTPGQNVSLDIDTGSSDVWMFSPSGCPSIDIIDPCALFGYYDYSNSSTSEPLGEPGDFYIQYLTENSGVVGDYVGDDLHIGGITVKNLTMGVATDSQSVFTGVMGIGFDTNEAQVSQTGEGYFNFIDELQKQGFIKVKSYSLYLDDLEAESGTILFGGIDQAKFDGELGILNIQPDSQSDDYTSFGVVLNAVGVTDGTGSTVLTTSSLPVDAILDSGTAITIVPDDMFEQLVSFFGASPDDTYDWVIKCDMNGHAGTLDFQFGNDNGPIVSVPFDELAIPLQNIETGEPILTNKNERVCRFGLANSTSTGETYLFGDTFLRSAYVVYDLDNLQIGIAQTKFNQTDSNILVITASGTKNLPGSIASATATPTQSRTRFFDDPFETDIFTTSATKVTESVASVTGSGDAALRGSKTTFANRQSDVPTTVRDAGGSQNAASSYRASPAGPMVNIAAQLLSGLAVAALGGMIFL